jgi:hypothetical protein
MEYIYLGAIVGLCLFNLWSYRRGLKDGLALNKGQTIAPIQTPVQAYTAHVERKAEVKKANEAEDKITDGLANLMSYDGTPQKAKEGDK